MATDGRFVGRQAELAQLAASARDACLLVVEGEAGAGKTRLVAEATAAAPGLVTWSTGWDGDAAPPYWMWAPVLRACLDALGTEWRDTNPARAALVDTLIHDLAPSRTVGDSSRFGLFRAVVDLLTATTATTPLTVVFDDVQWADPGTLALLDFVLRDAPPALTVLATARTEDVGADNPLRALLGRLAGRAHTLVLGGMTPEELAELVDADDGSRAAPDRVAELHRRTGGNPFFARELHALGAAPPVLPVGVRAVVERRLARLPQDCVDLLGLLAVLGGPASLDELAAVAGIPAPVAGDTLEPARRGGVVVAGGPAATVEFAHDLFRETLYDMRPALQRARDHATAAEMLHARDTRGTRTAEWAHHMGNAVAVVGPRRAADAAAAAGDEASRVFADDEAAAWYRRALDLVRVAGPPEPGHEAEPDEVSLLLALGEAEARAGRLDASKTTYLEAAALTRRLVRPDLLADAALGLGAGLTGFEIALFDATQITLLEEALRGLPPTDSARRALVMARLSVAMAFVADDRRRLDLSEAAVRIARELGDPLVLGHALAARCDAVAGPEHTEVRRALADETVRLASQAGDRRLGLLGLRHAALASLELGDMDAFDDHARQFAADADVIGDPLYGWYVPLWRGMRALMHGDTAAAAAACAAAAAIGDTVGSVNCRMLTLTQTWVRLRVEGRFAEASQALMTEAGEVFGPEPGNVMLEAICHLHAGDLDRARAAVARVRNLLEGLPRDSEWLATLAQAAEVASALGDADLASVVDELLAPFDGRVVVEGIGAAVCGPVGAVRAPLARMLGRPEEADALAATASAQAATMGLVATPWITRPTATPTAQATGTARHAWLRRDGDTWVIGFDGSDCRIRHSKGVADLAVLLRRPGIPVPAADLARRDVTPGQAKPDGGLEVLDRRALAEYRHRLTELDAEIDAAEDDHDGERAARLRDEKEFLLGELRAAVGLGGRSRRSGDDVDRARKAVRGRLRDAIGRIDAAHPALGRHLDHSIRTGRLCVYEPEAAVEWDVVD